MLMKSTLNGFFLQEEDRLCNVRDSLWKVANINSAASVDDDRSVENKLVRLN